MSDAGIAAVSSDANERVDFLRDTEGRIVRVSGPASAQSERTAIAYQYDAAGRLILARALDGGSPVGHPPYAYSADGQAAALTRNGIDFFRENQRIGQTALLEDMANSYTDLDYLTGRKVQPIAFSGDLSRVYVAGNGRVYVIDTLSFKLIDTLKTQGMNIVSLAAVGNLLILGEGCGYGVGASGARLLAMNINPGAGNYHQPITLQGSGIEHSPLGVSGLAIGPDGRTLVVAVPNAPDSVMSVSVSDARKHKFD